MTAQCPAGSWTGSWTNDNIWTWMALVLVNELWLLRRESAVFKECALKCVCRSKRAQRLHRTLNGSEERDTCVCTSPWVCAVGAHVHVCKEREHNKQMVPNTETTEKPNEECAGAHYCNFSTNWKSKQKEKSTPNF